MATCSVSGAPARISFFTFGLKSNQSYGPGLVLTSSRSRTVSALKPGAAASSEPVSVPASMPGHVLLSSSQPAKTSAKDTDSTDHAGNECFMNNHPFWRASVDQVL